MTKILETERLVLREFDLEDDEFIVELLNSPGWIRYIGNRKVSSRSDARKYLENGPIKSYSENGFGLSMVSLKFIDVPIGMCGLVKRDSLDDIDIGFAMLPDFEGLGYGFEVSSALLDYAHNTLGISRIAAITVEYNAASVALIEKLGMRFEKRVIIAEDDEELLYYAIDMS